MNKTISLACGNGGEENNELISKVFYKAFKNDILEKSEDAAIIEDGKWHFLLIVLQFHLCFLQERTLENLLFVVLVMTLL